MKLTTHSACYQTQDPTLQEWLLCARGMRVQHVHRRLWRWKIWGGCHNRKYCLYVCSDANSRTCFFFSESMWDVGLLLFFFSLSFFFHKIRKETDGCNNWNPPCSQFFCFWTELLFLSLHVMAGQVHLICTVQDHDCGARREEFYLAGCEYFTVETKNSFVYSERKHGERESSSQNFTQYRKLLAMRKKKFFVFFSWVLISRCELSVLMNMFLTSVYAKSCPFHGFLFYFSLLVKQLGVQVGSFSLLCSLPFKRPQSTLCFLVMFKIKNDKDNIHTLLRMALSPQLFLVFFFFFFALLKGNFPTQFV